MYLPRTIEYKLIEYVDIFPVVTLTGPRQSGKSTLLRHCFGKKYRYVSLDDPQWVRLLNEDPKGFMLQFSGPVIFDEVQKAPELFSLVKLAVDTHRDTMGQFILTGSSQFTLLKNITETLAGRAGLLTLLPFQYAEIPAALRQQAVYCGSYPELIKRDYAHRKEWYGAYVNTYLERDVRTLYDIGSLREFLRLLQLLAGRTAQLLNLAQLANDVGVSSTTIRRWISVLEASYIIFLLPPFYENFGKRIVKSPKIYFYDTGLAAYLTGIENQALYEQGPLTGPLFENYIVTEIVKWHQHHKTHKLYFLRTSNGEEIDLIVEQGAQKEWIEIKHTHTFLTRHVTPLKQLMPDKSLGILLYQGEALTLAPNLVAMPWWDYLEKG